MIALRVFLVVALALVANAQNDSKLAYKLSDCLKSAIVNGIPSIHIPSHNPFVFSRNLTWQGDVGIASATVELDKLTWYGIPTWNISIHQISDDSDTVAELAYRLSWDKFVMTSKYTLKTNVVLIPGIISGDLNITLDGNTWEGVVNYQKAGSDVPEGIDDLTLTWNLTQADFNFTGLGIINEPISRSLGSLFQAYFQSGALGNLFGEGLKERLNTVWFAHPERTSAILEFCNGNETLSY